MPALSDAGSWHLPALVAMTLLAPSLPAAEPQWPLKSPRPRGCLTARATLYVSDAMKLKAERLECYDGTVKIYCGAVKRQTNEEVRDACRPQTEQILAHIWEVMGNRLPPDAKAAVTFKDGSLCITAESAPQKETEGSCSRWVDAYITFRPPKASAE